MHTGIEEVPQLKSASVVDYILLRRVVKLLPNVLVLVDLSGIDTKKYVLEIYNGFLQWCLTSKFTTVISMSSGHGLYIPSSPELKVYTSLHRGLMVLEICGP